MKEVLKVTKDINRELLTELNSKDFVICECRKVMSPFLNAKQDPQFRTIKNLLNLKS